MCPRPAEIGNNGVGIGLHYKRTEGEEMPATKMLEKTMKMPEIRSKAKALGITPGRMKKAELIHVIQRAEGYTACFGKSNGQCPYTDCCFRADCLKVSL